MIAFDTFIKLDYQSIENALQQRNNLQMQSVINIKKKSVKFKKFNYFILNLYIFFKIYNFVNSKTL